METFKPIAMKCTQEQFEAIKPKLKETDTVGNFGTYPYLVNNCDNRVNVVTNVYKKNKCNYDRTVHEEWNEEIFLKACGIETETLQEKQTRLTNELNEVNRLIEEENKPKVGDWVVNGQGTIYKHYSDNLVYKDETKITDQDLIKKLNELIK